MNNREATNYLKAVAILAVCTNHFINGYITKTLSEYANGFISIFFLLSGYGIYHSLTKQDRKKTADFLIFFFKKRFMRIFPLFWIWCLIHGFQNGILGFFALDFIHPKSPWFVPAIIQCYLVAPFLFLFIERFRLRISYLFAFGCFVLLNTLLFLNGFSPDPSVGYRGLFFLHIFQFFLGCLLAKGKSNRTYSSYYAIAPTLLFFFFVQETTPQEFLLIPGKKYIFPLFLSFSGCWLCLTLLSINLVLPFKKIMNFIGIHSYSIFLFHGLSFAILFKMGIIHKYNTPPIGIIIWALTLPIFFLVFAAFETVVNEFALGKRKMKHAMHVYLNSLPVNNRVFSIKT